MKLEDNIDKNFDQSLEIYFKEAYEIFLNRNLDLEKFLENLTKILLIYL